MHYVARQNHEKETVAIVPSSSGDVDIPIILLANVPNTLNVFVDNGTGKSRKLLNLSLSNLSHDTKQALLGLHAFSGNDYVSAFFRKGKTALWSIVKDSALHRDAFVELGTENYASDHLKRVLEALVCHISGEKKNYRVWIAHEK